MILTSYLNDTVHRNTDRGMVCRRYDRYKGIQTREQDKYTDKRLHTSGLVLKLKARHVDMFIVKG